jgi:hypothetical protein
LGPVDGVARLAFDWSLGVSTMSVLPFARCEVFDPEEVELMGDVFEDILGTLHLPKRDDVLAQVVATRIIQLAKGGERNPERMRSATLASLGMGVAPPVAAT